MEQVYKDTGEITQPRGTKGEFFCMSLPLVNNLVREHDAGVEELMAYIVLSRGVSGRTKTRISTHGANSIAKHTGITYRKADAALSWLEDIKIAQKVEPKDTALQGKRITKRYVTDGGSEFLYLANALIDGIGEGKNNPPLMRIYNDVALGSSGLKSDARRDALMVLLHLYHYQDMEGCGGVDPRAGLFREWVAAENNMGESITELEGTNAALYEISGTSAEVFNEFAAEALFYVVDEEERNNRFWDAFHELQKMGFVYETTQIWSSNPNGKNGKKAEPLYTLYIHDRHARASDPYLQRVIHDVAINKLGAMDSQSLLDDYDETVVNSGQFRYVATVKTGGFPIGIYRLRFRAKTRDTGIGMEAEKRRVAAWTASLKKLHNGS